MKTQTIILILATLSTGIMAGIFFTWSNAVSTGIGRLSDVEYLRAFQAMNPTPLNPAFFLAIFCMPLFPFKKFLLLNLPPLTTSDICQNIFVSSLTLKNKIQ